MNKASVVVYGADIVCASCVNAPTSRNTFDWLQPLLKRKYPEISFEFTYIDIEKDTENLTDHDQQFIERIQEDELFYPLVTINDEYVARKSFTTRIKNAGPPITPRTMPTGSSAGRTRKRPTISAPRTRIAPSSADMGSSRACEGPTIPRAMCGH